MRKNNWVIAILAVLVAVAFVIAWYMLKFNKIDNPLDLVLGIVVVAFVIAMGIVLNRMEQKRREILRTMYVSGPVCYNKIGGCTPFTSIPELIEHTSQVLNGMDYRADLVTEPVGFIPAFSIATDEFDAENEKWTGNVKDEKTGVSNPFSDKAALTAAVSQYL